MKETKMWLTLAIALITVLVISGLMTVKAHSSQLYSASQLSSVHITDQLLSFPLPIESAFSPALVEFSRESANVIIVKIYKRLTIGPFGSLSSTPIDTASTQQRIPKYNPTSRLYEVPIVTFGFDHPEYRLKTTDAEQPLNKD